MELNGVDKSQLLATLRARLEDDLRNVTLAQKAAQEGATHEENRQESDKDMRSTEVSYLARGQAERVVSLREELALLGSLRPRAFSEDDAVAATALVRLAEDESETVHFLVPAGGGLRLDWQGLSIGILTPRSPLGQNLLGVRQGDVVGLDGPEGSREFEVIEVA